MTLPDRQLQVLLLIAEGLDGPEIAKRMFVSLTTVKSHKEILFEKLGARNAAHAVAQGYKRGLLVVEAADVFA